MERQRYRKTVAYGHASRSAESVSVKADQRLPQKVLIDTWPVRKVGCRKDNLLEAAQVLVQARNTKLISTCSNMIILLPASGAIPGVQGGSREKPLYSLRQPNLDPFKVHLWQIPAVQTWNETTWSWDLTPGKIMARRGHKSEPLTQLLKTLGVAKGEAGVDDLCNHFQCWRHLETRGEWLNEFPRHIRGTVYRRWWSFNRFPLMQLPPELREMILTFALGPIAVPFARRWHPKNRYSRLTMPIMPLLLISKQLNCEVTAALLAHTKFYFHSIEQFLKFLRHRDRLLKSTFQSPKGLRCLELDLNPTALLRLFGVAFGPDVFGTRNTHYEQSFALDLSMFFNDEAPLCHRMLIRIPYVFQLIPRPDRTCCQKVHNLATWAGARARLRSIAVLELVGHIDETQKKEWLFEHALERKGVIPEEKDFAAWQRGIWTQW